MSENLKNLENLKEKKSKFSLVFNPLTSQKLRRCSRPLSLVDNRYTKLGKIGEKVLLILGLSYIKIPLWYAAVTPKIFIFC
jgi:hypothetical protein